ncbi:MAG: TIGR01244 family sulfur transferase [Candidatus Competibacterales bacterium]
MDTLKALTPFLSVAPQLNPTEMGALAARGFQTVINNRPDGEADDQPTHAALQEAAQRHGLAYHHLPVVSGQITDADVAAFDALLQQVKGPAVAFCRSGSRSTSLWALASAERLSPAAILAAAKGASYDLMPLEAQLQARWQRGQQTPSALERQHPHFDVVVVGGGAGGISTAASLLRRRPNLSVAIVEPKTIHYYQPGWTLVGGGVFDRAQTERAMARCIPKGVQWIPAACARFEPQRSRIVLEDGAFLIYRVLVVSPGIELNWGAIDGLSETLGKNGVTSNYLFDMAAYTWDQVQAFQGGRALFTQPPMPIKCAGAPQKAMYLSCNAWERRGILDQCQVEFHNAGGVLFGVAAYVPPLMKYVERYGVDLRLKSNLVAVDGPAQTAWFDVTDADGQVVRQRQEFDLLHAVPPQRAPAFIRQSPLANEAGWVDLNPETLQHTQYGNVFGLGDAGSTPNAKTAAAVRKQAPVVAENLLALLDGRPLGSLYDGYGSCPLTVERGKIILAEFGYGGKLMPSFPWDSTVPRRSAWFLKEKMLPQIYWDLMLKGREWLAAPVRLPHDPTPHQASDACHWGATTPPGTATGTPESKKATETLKKTA